VFVPDASQELLLGRGTEYGVDVVVRIGDVWHVYGRVLR
jgi:hypothetical protein